MLLGTRPEYGVLLGLLLVEASPTKSPQRQLAVRLERGIDVDEEGDPVHLEFIASVHRANNMVQDIRRLLGTQIVANVDRTVFGMSSALVTETGWEVVFAGSVDDHAGERPYPEIDQAEQPSSPQPPCTLTVSHIMNSFDLRNQTGF